MYLTKDGITIEVAHPRDIARYKSLGFVETSTGYPFPEQVDDGKPAEAKAKKSAKKAVSNEP